MAGYHISSKVRGKMAFRYPTILPSFCVSVFCDFLKMLFSCKHPQGSLVRVFSKLTALNQKAMKVLRAVRILSGHPLTFVCLFLSVFYYKRGGWKEVLPSPPRAFHGIWKLLPKHNIFFEYNSSRIFIIVSQKNMTSKVLTAFLFSNILINALLTLSGSGSAGMIILRNQFCVSPCMNWTQSSSLCLNAILVQIKSTPGLTKENTKTSH